MSTTLSVGGAVGNTESWMKKQAESGAGSLDFWGKDGFGFSDLVDIVNPLHHIPVVSKIYQHFTGDQISTGANMLGGAVFGGPVGLLASFAGSIINQENAEATAIAEANPEPVHIPAKTIAKAPELTINPVSYSRVQISAPKLPISSIADDLPNGGIDINIPGDIPSELPDTPSTSSIQQQLLNELTEAYQTKQERRGKQTDIAT